MDEMRKVKLEAAGIRVEDALGRFMGNEMLLERFLKKFLDDVNFSLLKEAVGRQDHEEELKASHTLKGVCGNLSISGLYDLVTRQVALMREDRREEAEALMPEIEKAYETAAAAIRG